MGTTTILATQLIDQDGTPLQGSIYFGWQINLPITNGTINGTAESDTYDPVSINSSTYENELVQLHNITLEDGGTLQLDELVNGQWAAKVGSGWMPLSQNDEEYMLVVPGGPVTLPAVDEDARELKIVNSGAATSLSAPVPIGNAASPAPANSIALPALACLWIRYQQSTNSWRVLSLSTSPQ
ncbi:MAG TPA: hypothetical protein VKX25_19340 [Bryobacteraceae bacterium]|jgi:hypothetical protein|nr:hypothetical protein [Bryobacteraceae bacterium]